MQSLFKYISALYLIRIRGQRWYQTHYYQAPVAFVMNKPGIVLFICIYLNQVISTVVLGNV